MRHDGLALGRGQEVAPESHESTCRDIKVQQRPVTSRLHVQKSALPAGSELDRRADELLRNLDREILDRLAALSVDGLVQHLRLAYLQLESLTAHLLDEHGQVKHTTSINHE